MNKRYKIFCFFLFFFSAVIHAQIKYADEVINFSTQYSTANWSAARVLDQPSILICGDNSLAWASFHADDQREFLELGFSDPIPVNTIFIWESYNPGAVDTVYVLNPETSRYEIVYTATAAIGPGCPRELTISFPATSFPVGKIRIAINSPAVPGWNEIDAVGIAYIPESGTISGDQSVCAPSFITALQSVDSAYSGNINAVYQWQDSIASGFWYDISGATGIEYKPSDMTQTTYYRRRASCSGNISFSNVVTVTLILDGDPAMLPTGKWSPYSYDSTDYTKASIREQPESLQLQMYELHIRYIS